MYSQEKLHTVGNFGSPVSARKIGDQQKFARPVPLYWKRSTGVQYVLERSARTALVGQSVHGNDLDLGNDHKSATTSVPSVTLSVVVRLASCFVFAISLFALVDWYFGVDTPLVNPFAATLTGIAAPFFYWMGSVIARD